MWADLNSNEIAMIQNVKDVPYGVSDFQTMVEQNLYYVDKTMYIPELEKQAFIQSEAKTKGYPLYLIIDEYDNFTNTILNEQGKIGRSVNVIKNNMLFVPLKFFSLAAQSGLTSTVCYIQKDIFRMYSDNVIVKFIYICLMT